MRRAQFAAMMCSLHVIWHSRCEDTNPSSIASADVGRNEKDFKDYFAARLEFRSLWLEISGVLAAWACGEIWSRAGVPVAGLLKMRTGAGSRPELRGGMRLGDVPLAAGGWREDLC